MRTMHIEFCARPEVKVLTAGQCRAARGFLNWSKQHLAEAACVSVATIARLERMNGRLKGMIETEERIEAAFRSKGVQFIENGVVYKPEAKEEK